MSSSVCSKIMSNYFRNCMAMSNLYAQFNVFLQAILPQHFLTRLAGKIANCKIRWFKNGLIHWFIKRYGVDLSQVSQKNPKAYACFNDFFIRSLDMRYRPIVSGAEVIVSPADGTI